MHGVEKEKKIVALMIGLYCKKKHQSKQFCNDCQSLLQYANERIEKCPFQTTKTFCSNCSVHCYKEDKRNVIKEVMRFAGPRMIVYHPILAMKHLLTSKKEREK